MEEQKLKCDWCEEVLTESYREKGHLLCGECWEIYENQTGYCGLSCCMGQGCDQSC